MTPQTQAVDLANQLLAIAQDLYTQKTAIDRIAGQYTLLALGSTFSAMPTCATNPDGSLGAADTTPNAAHPIDNRVVQALARAVQASDLAGLVTFLQALSSLMAGSAVTQQGQAPQLLAKFAGG